MAATSALTAAFLSTPLLFLSSRQRRRNGGIRSSNRTVSVPIMTAHSFVRRKNFNSFKLRSAPYEASEQISNDISPDTVHLGTSSAHVDETEFGRIFEDEGGKFTAYAPEDDAEDDGDASVFFEDPELDKERVLTTRIDEIPPSRAPRLSIRQQRTTEDRYSSVADLALDSDENDNDMGDIDGNDVDEDEEDNNESSGDSEDDEDDEELISSFAKREGFGNEEDDDFVISDEFESDELPSVSSSTYSSPRRVMDDLDENDEIPDDDEDQYYGAMDSAMEYDDEAEEEQEDDEVDDEVDDVEDVEDEEGVDDDSGDDDDENEDDIRNAADILSDRGILSLGARKGWQRDGSTVPNATDTDDDEFDDTMVDKADLEIEDEMEDDADAEDDIGDEDILSKTDDKNDIDDYPDLDEDEDDQGLTTQGSVGRVWELCEDTYITITEPGESYGYELDEDDQEDQDMASLRRGKEGGWSGGLASYPSSDLQKGSKEWIARRTYELMTKASPKDLYRWSHRHLDPPPEIAALYEEEEPEPLPIGIGVFNSTALPSTTDAELEESEDLEDDFIDEELGDDMEALKRSIKFPCSYKFKLEGDLSDETLLPAIREATEGVLNRKVPDSAFRIEEADSRFNHRVTIVVDVKNARQVTELYDALRSTPGVKYSYG